MFPEGFIFDRQYSKRKDPPNRKQAKRKEPIPEGFRDRLSLQPGIFAWSVGKTDESLLLADAVDDGEHQTLDAVLRRAVRRDAQRVVFAVDRRDLLVDGHEAAQNRLRILHDVDVLEQMRDDLDAATHVMRHDVELAAHVFGEFADIEIVVQEQDADHRRRQEVRQVVGGVGELVELLLVLGVDRVELLVGSLQLLVGGEQLLVGCLQLLVDRLKMASSASWSTTKSAWVRF